MAGGEQKKECNGRGCNVVKGLQHASRDRSCPCKHFTSLHDLYPPSREMYEHKVDATTCSFSATIRCSAVFSFLQSVVIFFSLVLHPPLDYPCLCVTETCGCGCAVLLQRGDVEKGQ